MTIEELDLDIRTYNQIKRTGINTVEELMERLYLPESVRDFPTRTMLHIERALKAAGAAKFVRGEYITADDVEPEPLSWTALHGMCGKLIARDISTESERAFRVCWVYQFSGDDSRLIFQYNGNNYANSADDGGFYALRTEENSMSEEMMLTEKEQAEALHKQITGYGEVIYQSLYGMCTAIKQMRDSKLYKALGHSTFESYAQDMLGMTASQTYRYIKIADNLSAEFVESTPQIGIQKLYLLAMVPEETRTEIVQNTDLNETTVRELKMKLAQAEKKNEVLSEQVSEAEQQAADARKSEQKALQRASVLETDSAFQRQKIEQLEAQVSEQADQIDELESRPVEVAVPEPSHEVQNLQDAMRRINLEHEQWSAKMQDDHIKQVQEINRQHRAELDALRAEYEQKLAKSQAEGAPEPDSKAVFKVYLAAVIDAAKRMMAFLSAHPDAACRAQAEKAFQTILQEVNNEQAV